MIENIEHIGILSVHILLRIMTKVLKYHLLLWETFHKPPMTKQKESSKTFTGICDAGTPECG